MSFFKPKHIKEGKMLLKGVRKFVRYNRDLIKPEQGKTIEMVEGEFREKLNDASTSKEDLDKAAHVLTEACEKSVPSYQTSMLKENLEVIFVAVVIAMGIRAYFVQPFKIPTGSMQPTLNGIIAHPHRQAHPVKGEDYTEPGRFGQIWDKMYYGRSYINLVAEEDDTVLLSQMREVKFMGFFPRTEIPCSSGRVYTVAGPKGKVDDLITNAVNRNQVVKKDQAIARGFIDTGDQVLVDKFTYHWKQPTRGEVFVFVTRGIAGIERGFSASQRAGGSQHYIKRLGGVPGDHLKVEPPNLYINGKLAEEEGFQNVMSKKNGYGGYTSGMGYQLEFNLGEEEYVALGDNSGNSYDSRGWGTVPRDNIVGRALYVYLPFGHHWGRIH
ncbi:MAG: signal peptidase I [Verrucomicrobiales bacterium]|nr:signal peptidase I [Verrucomicrobiales bacterium]